jgi:flagellar biosynthesis/type III secretory pathway protein FliH
MDNLLTIEEKAGFKPYLSEFFDQKLKEGFIEALEKTLEKAYEIGFEIGFKEGMKIGLERNIGLLLHKNPDWTDHQIAECFEVTIDFVGKIRAK